MVLVVLLGFFTFSFHALILWERTERQMDGAVLLMAGSVTGSKLSLIFSRRKRQYVVV